MITLEQIRLLESRITRAVDLIRVLKEENSTLRKGLESAQKRMKELESLVEGFKSDQAEIESVILRTLHSLDELEEGAAARRQERMPTAAGAPAATAPAAGAPAATAPATEPPAAKAHRHAAPEGVESYARPDAPPAERAVKEELDIF